MADRRTPFRGSALESDSCPGHLQSSEMARPLRGGITRPSTERHVRGETVTDGCGPVRQTLRPAEFNRDPKFQSGGAIDEFRSHAMAQQIPGSKTENPIPGRMSSGRGTFMDPMTVARQPSQEQRVLGSGTSVDQMTFYRHPSPETKPFGSGTFDRQPSPEQKTFGIGTYVNAITVSRQPSQEQRAHGSGTSVDRMTFDRRPLPELQAFGSGTFVDPATVAIQQLPGREAFRSGTFVDQRRVDCSSSPEQPIFGSGTPVNQMTVDRQPSPEQKTFGIGTYIARQSSPEQRTLSMFPTQLCSDEVMEDGGHAGDDDDDSRLSPVAAAMETCSIEDDGDEKRPFVDSAVFAQDEDGDTYLHLAIISERRDLAQCLIHLAPDSLWLDRTNNLKQTPLHLATDRRQPNVIRRLLNRGARRVVHDRRGNTPLHIACSNGHMDCVQELTSSLPASMMTSNDLGFNKSNYEGRTCLHLAASKNHLDVIKYLVENCRVNVNQKELRRGCTILHTAVMTSNLELLDYLLSLPASAELIIDEPTYDGYTALQLACLTQQTHIEQKLLSAGAT